MPDERALTVRLDEDRYQRLRRESYERDVPRTDIIREALTPTSPPIQPDPEGNLMPDQPDHDTGVPLRSRSVLHMDIEDQDTFIGVDHVYFPEGTGTCHCGKPSHDPGLVGVIIGDETVLLSAEEALTVANRLTRAANLVLESEEGTPDLEREAARYGCTGHEPSPGEVLPFPGKEGGA